ncbi:MAG: MBL fold metallo-hydrolase [Desulfobacteraceae bacterium]|jgi:phosphoribosyl 1,2-cyclic phosphodiesterase
MRFSVLASGSSGNALYVETAETGILIDAGLSCKETLRRLEAVGADPERVDALVLTHEHTDHIRGAGPVARRLGIPVYANRPTLEQSARNLGNLPETVLFRTGSALNIGDLTIETFTKCHDAADPVGLVLSVGGVRLGMITDLGRSTRLVEHRLKGCQALVMEFNHDLDLLEQGSYPVHLKRRIRGPEGHLSNGQAQDLIRTLAHEGLSVLIPAHMSRENNRPEMAYQEAGRVMAGCGLNRSRIEVSLQDEPLSLIELD